MKLYTQYLSTLKNLRKGSEITKAYFTSFNLSPEFFETYILPPLLDEDVPDNSFQYESLNVRLEELEGKLDIKVFYDANMMQLEEQKRTILKFNPILMTNEQGKKKGLFHPKVIYLENKKGKGKLFVGSGNLTLQGWGRNIEAFQSIDVNENSNIYNQIYNFFVDVKAQARLGEGKTVEPVNYDDKCNFVYSYKNNFDTSIFLKNINADSSSNLYVWSPYFSESANENINTIIEKNFPQVQNIHIIPDLVGSEKKIRLKNKPQSKKIKFYALKDQDSLEMNHSKVWITDSKIGIGSYNFTKEALFGVNFEAAFIEDVEDIKLDLESIDFNQMNEIELRNEDLQVNTNYNVVFELIANYEEQSFKINKLAGTEIDSFSVFLPSEIECSESALKNLSIYDKEKIFRALMKDKKFKVIHQNEIVYEGIILEKSTKGFREPVKVETMDDLFISFLDEKKPFSSKKLKDRNIDFDKNYDEPQDTQTDTSYLNYYNLFKGFENLKNKLPDNEKDLKHYCFTSGNSISSMMVVIEDYKTTHYNLFTYLFIKEFNILVEQVNKILEDKIQPIDNIELNLESKDKKFLEAF